MAVSIFTIQATVPEKMRKRVYMNYVGNQELHLLLDSGANRHCAPHGQHLAGYKEIRAGTQFATIADGERVPVTGAGTLKIKVPATLNGNRITKILILRGVLHVPKILILSVRFLLKILMNWNEKTLETTGLGPDIINFKT